ncbi:EamA family transporter [Stackebrandtia nassauensis]|uniref:peptide-methionine (S)-S-oxide reductase n=1 Tax=Stackebrandtia nassauensis (strain DSM 44728 / CIP 108903 / NRRL B-16338 / NBRC 102104 / LLR-40K-21) TaxID=446470 RepID=D3Q957_STANL|nr:EamA family transporter [Stackebrandtia nassauensis]ADD40666.1 peptide methionine sulfoxide reductase [Stackebrandtia nassauensis DSM 44728]
MSSPTVLPWLALFTVWIFWGSTYLGIQFAVETIPPLLMAGFRYLLAGAVMFAIVGPRHARGPNRPTPRQWRSMVIVAVLLLVGGNGLLSVGETSIDSGLAALIVATVPVWMLLIDAAVNRSRITVTMAIALALGTAGVGVLVGGPGSRVDLFGAIVVLIGALSWASGTVYARRAPQPKHPLVVASLQMIAGGVVLILVAAVTGEFGRLELAAISARSIAGFGWLVVAGSMLAFTAYGYANANLPTSTVATYAYVNPVVAVVLGVLLGDESLSANLLLGGGIIVSAVVLIVGGQAAKRREKPRPREVHRQALRWYRRHPEAQRSRRHMFATRHTTKLPADEALPGRPGPLLDPSDRNAALGTPLLGPYPDGMEIAEFGVDCFWGGEAQFWDVPGVWTTVAGFQGGHTPNPLADEILSHRTGHTEAVRVVFDPAKTSYEKLLAVFWCSEDPTRRVDMRGHGRSAIFTQDAGQLAKAEASRKVYQRELDRRGYGAIITEILSAQEFPFYPAQLRHQQHLARH